MKSPQGRKPIPKTIRGARVEDVQSELSASLCEAVRARIDAGEVSLGEVARRMRTPEHVVAGYLVHPSRVNSLRHVGALALAAGVRVRLEIDGGEAAGVAL